MLTNRPRGTADILLDEANRWRYVEKIFQKVCCEYNYLEIRTPIFEHTELFERGVGDTTDIVEKEMYTFFDRGNRSITLRPEGTAPAVRAYLENKLSSGPQPVKLWYCGPMFRYDRPQAGRLRQFHQLGAEVIGSDDPAVDAELMIMLMDFYDRLGLKDLELQINSVGCPNCRNELWTKLQDYFKPVQDKLCNNCRSRMHKNPLRILDCKVETCGAVGRNAPTTLDYLCQSCNEHFIKVQNYLEQAEVRYIINNRLVRGLDDYTHTAFEISAPEIGAQSSIGGGGRYNGLVKSIGGPAVPGVGYALGFERILLAMEKQNISGITAAGPSVFIAVADEAGSNSAFAVMKSLRSKGISADKDYMGRSLKAQMKYAGKIGCRFVIILGAQELSKGVAAVKDMHSGNQFELSAERIAEEIEKII